MENKMELKGVKVLIRIDADGVYARDRLDIANDESLFTQSKRGIEDLIKEIVSTWNESETTFGNVLELIRKHNIKYHQYCGLD